MPRALPVEQFSLYGLQGRSLFHSYIQSTNQSIVDFFQVCEIYCMIKPMTAVSSAFLAPTCLGSRVDALL